MARLSLIKQGLLPIEASTHLSDLEQKLSKAIQSMGHNHSMCHGDASLIQFLQMVSTYKPELISPKTFNQLLDEELKIVNANGLKNGIPFNLFSPGLMLGSLGLAFQILKINNPTKVPDLLLLQ